MARKLSTSKARRPEWAGTFKENPQNNGLRLKGAAVSAALLLLPAVFLGVTALASSPQEDLEYQRRLLDLAESARELDEQIQALGVNYSTSEKDRVAVYLATRDDDLVPFGDDQQALERWTGVKVRLDGVEMPQGDLHTRSMLGSEKSAPLKAVAFWSMYVSPGSHEMEMTFFGRDAMGKYVEITQRQPIDKNPRRSEMFVIRLPQRSRPVVAKPTGGASQAVNDIAPSIEWAR
ncbi:MAG: hypothetical protein ACWA5X_08165 [bacterium]